MEEPKKVTSAPVMNGTVAIGDSVAFAVRDGNGGGMRIGNVADAKVWERGALHYNVQTGDYEERPFWKLKVRVTQSLPYPTKRGYETWVGHELVVRLGADAEG
jgi:hypothetical protein